MHVKVNGHGTTLSDDATLVDLLRTLDIDAGAGVAVAVNEAVVPRHDWTSRPLEDGDVVEVVRAVQGG
jgi:sulfur carrier protein